MGTGRGVGIKNMFAGKRLLRWMKDHRESADIGFSTT